MHCAWAEARLADAAPRDDNGNDNRNDNGNDNG